MKRIFFPLLATGLLALASCGDSNKAVTAENGNASDNTMTGTATGGDTVSTTMPAGASDPENQPQNAGTAQGTNGNGAMRGVEPGSPYGRTMGEANGPTMPHATDKEFMMSAAHSDQNEIQLSKLVLAKGVTGMPRGMAEMMIMDHTKSTALLKTIAAKRNVTLPTDMDAKHKAIAANMQKLSGQELERQYMAQMLNDHQVTINTMEDFQRSTKDADLRGFIAEVLPVVRKHLIMDQRYQTM